MPTKAVAMSRSHKAAQLVAGGHVHRITDTSEVFEVYSPDSDTTYIVTLAGPKLRVGVCACRYGAARKSEQGECSHVIAARVQLAKPANPFTGLPNGEHPYGRP